MENFNTLHGKRINKMKRLAEGFLRGHRGTIERRYTMMSLPFVLFACAIGAAWMRHRSVSMGFWALGLVAMLILFRFHFTEALMIKL